jgi:hypothetical protein
MCEQSPTSKDKMQSAIQLAGFHYIVCLKTVPTNADHEIFTEKIAYSFDNIRKTDNRTLHIEFQRWAAMVVLRDLIESFSVFLMEVYRDNMQAKPTAAYSATLAQFERMGIEDQLGILANDFAIDAAWTSRLIAYNKARNCLAHRQGIVGPRDVTDGSELVIRWLVSKIELTDGPVTPFIEAVGPMSPLIRAQHIHGEPIYLEVHDKEKRVAIGAYLNFLPTDILEIIWTFQMAAAVFGIAKLKGID